MKVEVEVEVEVEVTTMMMIVPEEEGGAWRSSKHARDREATA